MATFHIPIICTNTVGSTNFKVKYRLAGDPVWTSDLISATSGTTYVLSELQNNRIYDIQVQNLNGAGNDLSQIAQQCGLIFEEDPTLSPTSDSIGYSFDNLSQDIDAYTVQLTTVANPAEIIATTTVAAGTYPGVISGAFNDLDPITGYRIVIIVAANQFSSSFEYIVYTGAVGTCASPTNVRATIS